MFLKLFRFCILFKFDVTFGSSQIRIFKAHYLKCTPYLDWRSKFLEIMQSTFPRKRVHTLRVILIVEEKRKKKKIKRWLSICRQPMYVGQEWNRSVNVQKSKRSECTSETVGVLGSAESRFLKCIFIRHDASLSFKVIILKSKFCNFYIKNLGKFELLFEDNRFIMI